MVILQITPEQQLYIGLGAVGVVILFLIIIFSNRAKHKARADTMEKVHEDDKKTVVHVVKHKKADDDDDERPHRKSA